jgi:hypothetical protein
LLVAKTKAQPLSNFQQQKVKALGMAAQKVLLCKQVECRRSYFQHTFGGLLSNVP